MAKRVRTRSRIITYTPSLGRVIAKGAKRSRIGRFHVISSISDEDKWSLVSEGSTKPIRDFTTKDAAVSFVRKSDVGRIGYVVIHSRDGRIQDRVTLQTRE
jgi:Uncharacterized protein conserved in bacteria (DUF2188)